MRPPNQNNNSVAQSGTQLNAGPLVSLGTTLQVPPTTQSHTQIQHPAMSTAPTVTGSDNGPLVIPVQQRRGRIHVNREYMPNPSPTQTIIVPYPVDEPRDSVWQVMLDLFRAKGLAHIDRQYQTQQQSQAEQRAISEPEESTVLDTKPHDDEEWKNKMIAQVEIIGKKLEKQKQEREEERSKTFKGIQVRIDQLRRRLQSKQAELEPCEREN